MTPHAHFPCAKTAAVLALHLDGDIDGQLDGQVGGAAGGAADDTHGYAFVDPATLHEHLRDCGSCQATLRRARRLDAALANAAGASVSAHQQLPGASLPELQERWFAALAAAAPPAAAARRQLAPRAAAPVWWLVATAATLAAGLVVAWRFAGGGTAAASYLPARMVPVARAVPAPAGTAATLAPLPTSPPLPELVAAPDAVRQLQQRRTAGTAPLPDDAVLAATFANAPAHAAACAADSASPATRRLAATGSLLDACRGNGAAAELALRQLVGALAACGGAGTPVALHARQLELLREARPTRVLLAAWLQQLDVPGTRLAADDVAAIAVAARLGAGELDGALRRLARRHEEAGGYVAAALRCAVRPHGGARLLLDLWQDGDLRQNNDARRDGGPDPAVAQRWFGAQPAAVFAEVIAELRASRATARRLHCLLALGAAGDDSTLATLLEHAQSRHRDEAVAAAFALSCLPLRVLDAVVPLAAADDAFLLRGALARAHHDAAHAWLDALAGRANARERLLDADLARFAEIAACLRDRNSSD